MKRVTTFVLSAVLLLGMVVSCKKADAPISAASWFAREGLTITFDNEQFQDEVAYLGGLKSRDVAWIRARAGSKLVSDPTSAHVIILGGSLLDGHIQLLKKAYSAGKVIIIENPDLEKLKQIRDTLFWHIVIPGEKPSTDFALGFFKHNSILLTPPARILTDPEEHKGKSDIEITGEKVYENASIFQSARALMNFIKRSKADKGTKSSVNVTSLNEDLNTMEYELPFSECWETSIEGRYLRVFNSFSIGYSVYPCYIPEGVNNHGDHYAIMATATNFAPTMYEYGKPEDNGKPDVPVGNNAYAHYWPREYSYWGDCQFRGPYNTQMEFIAQAKNAKDLYFASNERPLPGTDIDTRSYGKSVTRSWQYGMSGGLSESEGFHIGFNSGMGGEKSDYLYYSMSDMKVVNNSDNNSVSYNYQYQNLPNKDDDFDNYEDKMPSICKSTADFPMSWEWKTDATKDNDGKIIPLKTTVTQHLNIWTRDKHVGWSNYMNSYKRKNVIEDNNILSVARVPIGCLRINNKCESNQILFDIKIYDSSTGEEVYAGINNVCRDEYFEVLLPQKDRQYYASLSLGKNSYDKVQYYSYDSQIALPLAVSAQDFDRRILTVVETGGDFTSRAGYLRVVNQSQTNLVRNLKVCTAAGEIVYSHRSSLGYGHVADIYLNSNVEYYVTMEYGSASTFKEYRSEENFRLPLYQTELEILTLVANDNNGGDFVLK